MSILGNRDDGEPGVAGAGEVEDRDRRALTERMIVLPEAPGLFRVWSGAREYLVDAMGETCECEDSVYRGVTCKHLRRVRFATGARDIPAGVPLDDVDPLLGKTLEASR